MNSQSLVDSIIAAHVSHDLAAEELDKALMRNAKAGQVACRPMTMPGVAWVTTQDCLALVDDRKRLGRTSGVGACLWPGDHDLKSPL